MKTAIDSSVLLTIFNGEPDAERWLRSLIGARREGVLVLSDVVYAEVAPAFDSQEDLQNQLDRLGVSFETMLPAAAFLAGQIFRRYRVGGGPRKYMIPDFLIAAHACVQADRLAAVDRGYLRRYFPDLPLLAAPIEPD